MDKNQFK